jgi:UDP-N-acetylglucosamine:LPS N-acetylglucosamine transferase
VALVARSRRELARLLERALTEPGLLEHLRARIAGVRRPDAAQRIVDAVLASGPVRA